MTEVRTTLKDLRRALRVHAPPYLHELTRSEMGVWMHKYLTRDERVAVHANAQDLATKRRAWWDRQRGQR